MQLALVRRGHPIFWYDDVVLNSPSFIGMQMGGARQWWKPAPETLHGNADEVLREAKPRLICNDSRRPVILPVFVRRRSLHGPTLNHLEST